MRATRVVLCDLDDTLFDHTGASRAALAAVQADVPAFGIWSDADLADRHAAILERVHLDVLAGRVGVDEARQRRFAELLAAAGAPADAGRVDELTRRYRAAYEAAWQPVPGACELIRAIVEAGASVGIVTNNLEDEQRTKLRRLGLEDLVGVLVTTDQIGGVVKPGAAMFLAGLARLGAAAEEAVMLGDGWETDIEGALGVGVRAVWLNRLGRPSPDPSVTELRSLEPLEAALAAVLGGQRLRAC